MIDIASKYINAGLSILPVNPETKAPTVPKWQQYQREKINPTEFENSNGIAVICGQVSNGLECLDFDNHIGNADQILKEYSEIVEVEEVLTKYNLPIESSPSGGYHIFFRSKSPSGNQKLARMTGDNDRPTTVIETRGEGGYIIAAPTVGYKMQSGDLLDIPHITMEDRDILISAAKSFNKYVDKKDYSTPHINNLGDRPGDEYNNDTSTSIEEAKKILLSSGWKNHGDKNWIRPGKKKGISATFGFVAPNVFYVFSSNAYPFEETSAYTPFQILALLSYNGDFESAAKDLAKRGYGKKNDNLKVVWSTVRKETRKGNKLSPEDKNTIAETLNIPVDQVNQEITKAEKNYSEEWEYEKKPPIEKAEMFLEQRYSFRQDVISRLPYMKKAQGQWEDLNVDTIFREMLHEKIKFTMDGLKSLLRSNFVEKYNPFISYFHSIPEWDGVDHIQNVADHFKIKDDHTYFSEMFKKALVRNIACSIESENYNRLVFTLVSEEQWIGKSFFLQWLNPFGTKYYTDEMLKDNKDSRFALCENFIYNLEELDSLSRGDLGKLKATISCKGVKDRLPYASNKEYFPRTCSFWGSTNRHEFLVDDKNTRWLCFYINDIDWAYSKIDIHKLWQQAWHLYNSEDFDYNLTSEEAKKRDLTNEDYRVIDFETSMIVKHFIHSDEKWMSNAEIMEGLHTISDGKVKLNTTPQKLGRIMAQLGFQRRKAKNERGWACEIKYHKPSSF